MTHFMRSMTALFVLTLLLVAAAQDTEPLAPPPHSPLPAFDEAMVRFVHLSPNAGAVRVTLSSDDVGLDEQHVVELDYLQMTEYRRVREGSFEIAIDVEARDDEPIVAAERVHAVRSGYYTVALLGLAIDDRDAEVADDDGFFAWLQGLFTPDRPELALRALVLDDAAVAGAGPRSATFRVVHAAPGTDVLEFVHVHDDTSEVLASVSYYDVTGFFDVLPENGSFEMRFEGADATIAVVDDVEPVPGRIHTIFLVGTPIEEVPLDTLVVSADWALVGAMTPGAPGVGVTGYASAPELVTMRELVFEVGARIEVAEQRLDEVSETDDPEALADARRELAGATQLLEQVHLLLDRTQRRVR